MDDVTEVAADFMYLIVLGESDIIEHITDTLNDVLPGDNLSSKYMSIDIDTQIDNLLETSRFRDILNKSKLNSSNSSNASIVSIDSKSNKSTKYFVINEGVETAQCYTYAENFDAQKMIIQLTESDDSFNLTFPILNLDDEVNPDDLIDSWFKEKELDIENRSIKLINMVGSEHDILVFAVLVY